MKQAKRLFYMILLNIIISAITVGVVLQLWERDHPPISADNTPAVLVVTATGPVQLTMEGITITLGTQTPDGSGNVIVGTVLATPTIKMLTYRIKEGDTLGALAIQFNLSIEDIMIANGLTNPDSLYVGQIIYIPTAPLPKVTDTSIPPTSVASSTPRPSATRTPTPIHTSPPPTPTQEPQVEIATVIGAGTLENERVVLHHTGDGELSMAGWRLTDGKSNEYIFPQLTLYKGGSINLNTRTGQNTVVDLFWGLKAPIWSSGESISLYDSQNRLRATYTIP